MEMKKRLVALLSSVVLEPVAFLLMMFVGLIMLTSQELYLMKACKVNLNYTEAECDNINDHSEVQIATQRYVSQIQAYNGALQSVPGIILAFFTGPLSDRFGRKPLIVFSLFGYLILSVVFLLNSIWFSQLKVGLEEYHPNRLVSFLFDFYHFRVLIHWPFIIQVFIPFPNKRKKIKNCLLHYHDQ